MTTEHSANQPSETQATNLAAAAVLSNFNVKINEYSQWRNYLTQTINEYVDWLARAESMDAMQELRLFDIKEILKKDQLVLAFLAEFSRGKTETINALFFQTLTSACCLASQGAPQCAQLKFFGTHAKSHALSCFQLKPDKPMTRFLISKVRQISGTKLS